MLGRYVGWIRQGWTTWEPILTGDDEERLWEQLLAIDVKDIDGERLVLPSDENPLAASSQTE